MTRAEWEEGWYDCNEEYTAEELEAAEERAEDAYIDDCVERYYEEKYGR